MNIPNLINKVQTGLNSKAAVIFDWALAVLTILYGAFLVQKGENPTTAWLVVSCGIIGLILAYVRPSKVANQLVAKTISKKNN